MRGFESNKNFYSQYLPNLSFDNETAGLDGFLFMSHSWFLKNVLQVVIHKNLLSRTTIKLLSQTPIFLNPWECTAPALKIKPINYRKN